MSLDKCYLEDDAVHIIDNKTTNKLLKYVYARLFDVPYIFYSEMHEFLKILKLNFYNKQNISSYLGENMPLFILTSDMTPPHLLTEWTILLSYLKKTFLYHFYTYTNKELLLSPTLLFCCFQNQPRFLKFSYYVYCAQSAYLNKFKLIHGHDINRFWRKFSTIEWNANRPLNLNSFPWKSAQGCYTLMV